MQARDLGIGIILDDLDFPVEFNKRSKLSVNETSVTCFNGFTSVQGPSCQVPVGIIDEEAVTAKLLNINAGTANIQDAR